MKIFALAVKHPEQEPLVNKHCFGDCGKISMGGAVMTQVGVTMLCFQEKCPHEVQEMQEPLGAIDYEDIAEHEELIYLRVFVTDAMRERLKVKKS
jgi:hypothetical protein